MSKRPLNVFCISTYFKGVDFLKTCKAQGNKVYLLTLKSLEKEEWPRESIDEILFIDEWVDEHVKDGLAYIFQSVSIDRIVALDDFDVERAASIREHFRIPGMGQTTARYFRDKLAMRLKSRDAKVPIPEFTPLFNDEQINLFADSVEPPWLIKPRHEASAKGIQKIQSKSELWEAIHELGRKRHNYLVEKFAPGDVYHVDGLNFGGKVLFAKVSKYVDTPFDVAHKGGIFRSYTIESNTAEDKALKKINMQVMAAFGMLDGVSHSEFIRSKDSKEIFFLETSSRVGGANLAEMVEAASGINLWTEWAKIETLKTLNKKYVLPKVIEGRSAGIVVSLSRYEQPDTSSFKDQEIVWRMKKPWHIGLIVTSSSNAKVLELLDKFTLRIKEQFHASLPAEKATH
jgi:biotin carboxylase